LAQVLALAFERGSLVPLDIYNHLGSMKLKSILTSILIFSLLSLQAQDITQQNFTQALEELTSMLQGTQPLDFERAVFITENAYHDNTIA
jgi:hypothetical protein